MYINSVYYMDGSPRRILAQTGGGDFFYNAKTGLPLGGTTDIPGENYLVLKTGERIRWTEDDVERLPAKFEYEGLLPAGGKRIFQSEVIKNVSVFEDINCLAVLTEHNVLKFYNLTTFEKEREFVSQQRENNPVKK